MQGQHRSHLPLPLLLLLLLGRHQKLPWLLPLLLQGLPGTECG
jgi:hypothetical protein